MILAHIPRDRGGLPTQRGRGAVGILGVALSLGWALVTGSAALADTVVLRSGTVYQGTIEEDTPAHVRIKTRVNSIVTTLTIKKGEIRSITKGPLPADFFPPQDAPRPSAPAERPPEQGEDEGAPEADPAPTQSQYFVIPIEGTIG